MIYRKVTEAMSKTYQNEDTSRPSRTPDSSNRERNKVKEFAGIKEFVECSSIRNGRVRVWDGGLPIDFEVSLSLSAPMLIILNGVSAHGSDQPWFVKQDWYSDLELTSVTFVDPSRHLDKSLEQHWFAGSTKQPNLQKHIQSIVVHLAQLATAKQLIFFGASDGGFAALETASRFENSTALVMNPLTAIEERRSDKMGAYKESCWGGEIGSGVTVDLAEKFGSKSANCNVFYLQHANNQPQMDQHMKPLLQSLNTEYEFYVNVGEWTKGHRYPPRDLVKTALQEIVVSQDTFSMVKLGFQDARDERVNSKLTQVSRRGGIEDVLGNQPRSIVSLSDRIPAIPSGESYLSFFDYAGGRSWTVTHSSEGCYSIKMPSKQEFHVETSSLHSLDFWKATFPSQNSTNKLWLRTCWYAVEIARRGDLTFALEILSSYHAYLKSNNLDPNKLAFNSFDHCLALNLRTCAWMLIVPELSADQREKIVDLVGDLMTLTSKFDRFLAHNHGIMLALGMMHASVASGIHPPSSHSLSRLTDFLISVFDYAISDNGLVRENTSIYQFLWVKWAWEVANTFEYMMGERQIALNFAERADKIEVAAELFGIDSRSTLPIGDGGRRSAPVFGPRKGILDGSSDGHFILNSGDGHVFSYSAGSPTAVHRHVDEHALRLYHEGRELISDAGFNSYDVSDPVSRCVTSQRGHSGLYFPQFDYLPGSKFYPTGAPEARSHGTLRIFEASQKGARLISHRIVDEVFTTQRRVNYNAESLSIDIHDSAMAPHNEVKTAPVSRFLLPSFLAQSPKNALRFEGEGSFVEFFLSPGAKLEIFQGSPEWQSESDELRGIICPRPGQPESAWVLEVPLVKDGTSNWSHSFSVRYGKAPFPQHTAS